MTVQLPETLLYQGEESGMSGAPLSDYFAMGGFEPRFAPSTSMLWRGYIGRWEIIDARLYLIGLKGTLEDGTKASVASIFPDFPDRVFAHWYSGTICVPRGEILEYQFDVGVFERDLLLDVERGVVVATRIRDNGTAESNGAPGAGEGGVRTASPPDHTDDRSEP
jgi:hypothetical protein